jgi:hypothetical protein
MEIYGNKNIQLSGQKELDALLLLLSDADEELCLYALGGTALVIENLKQATKDIDFMTDQKHNILKKIFSSVGLKEKDSSPGLNIWYMDNIRIDIMYEGYIFCANLPDDWKEKSAFVKKVGKIKLYRLDWLDIICSKTLRLTDADIYDIKQIFKKEKIDIKKLKKRYDEIVLESILPDAKYNFNIMIKNCCDNNETTNRH